MTWRPKEGWAHRRSEYFEQNQPVKPYRQTRQKDYEAGADTMLEALKKEELPADIKEAITRAQNDGLIDWRRPNGQVVFIPDEGGKR